MSLKPASAYRYENIAPPSKWLGVMLVMDLVMSVVGFGSTLLERSILTRFSEAELAEFDEVALQVLVADAERSDLRQMIVGYTQIAVAVVTAIVFCRWIYVASRNCHAMYAGKLQFTPGWSVGWFFVPIASLWKPFQAMRQTWNVSADPLGDPNRSASDLVVAWWIIFLISDWAGRAAFRLAMKAEEVSQLQTSNTFSLISDGVNIFATITAYLLVKKITGLQIQNFAGRSSVSSGPLEPEPAPSG